MTSAPKSTLSKLGIKERDASLNKLIYSKTLTKIPIRDRPLTTLIFNEKKRRRYLWSNITNVAWSIGKKIMAPASIYNPKRPSISGIRSALRNGLRPLGNHDYMDHILSYVSI
jgi:hypothetical protein